MSFRFRYITFIGNLLLPAPSYSRDLAPKIIESFVQKIDRDFESGMGGVAAIVHKGKVVYKKTFGHEYAGGPAISDDTYFSIGSVSKAVTATVIADLIREKKLQLSTPLTKTFASAPPEVQLQDLLSHNSGFTFKGNWQIEQGRSRESLISEILRQGRGKQEFQYNNLAFSLIENMVEKETQSSWHSVFHQTLAKHGLHLGLSTPVENASVAHPHFKDEKLNKLVSYSRLPRFYPERVSSSAGVYASLKDLIKFAQLQFQTEYDFLHTPRVPAADVFNWNVNFPVPRKKVESSYALGWRVLELKNDKTHSSRLVFHGGYLRGISAFVGFMKSHDLAFIVVRNDELLGAPKIASGVWSAYLTASAS